MEEALFTLVTSEPAVRALIGTRFYPDILPEPATLPAVTYSGISLVDWRTFDGAGLSQIRLEFHIWASSRRAASAVEQALFALLDEYSGKLPGGPAVDILRDGTRSGFDQEVRRYYVQTDWLFQVGAE